MCTCVCVVCGLCLFQIFSVVDCVSARVWSSAATPYFQTDLLNFLNKSIAEDEAVGDNAEKENAARQYLARKEPITVSCSSVPH